MLIHAPVASGWMRFVGGNVSAGSLTVHRGLIILEDSVFARLVGQVSLNPFSLVACTISLPNSRSERAATSQDVFTIRPLVCYVNERADAYIEMPAPDWKRTLQTWPYRQRRLTQLQPHQLGDLVT